MAHPDDEIIQKWRNRMNHLARFLDEQFNGTAKGLDREVCFVLLTAPFNVTDGRVNYISNGPREDVVAMLKEIIARFEGQPKQSGTA